MIMLIKPSPFKDSRGISLMEAIAVMGVMTIVLVMVGQMFSSGYNLFVYQSARVDAEVGAVLASRAISAVTRGALTVEASAVIGGTTYTSDSDTLVLKIPSIDSSKNVIATQYDYVAVFIDPSDATLVKTATAIGTGSIRPAGTKLITASNSVLRFRYNDPTIVDATRVQMYLVNTQIRRSTTISAKAWTAIFLRNK